MVKNLSQMLAIVGSGANAIVQAVTKPSTRSRLSLLSARPAFTFPADEHHHPLAGTKLYCVVTGAHACEQLAQGW